MNTAFIPEHYSILPMIAKDIFPILAFCFGFIVTRVLSSHPRTNEMRGRSEEATGIRLCLWSNLKDVELGGSSHTQCQSLTRRPPQSTKELAISFGNVGEHREQGRELRMMAALGRIPEKQRRNERSVRDAPLRGPLSQQPMKWSV